jgi:diguanylate cyclase (GGDEF)-like protein/PAS domain S-box-containing protein
MALTSRSLESLPRFTLHQSSAGVFKEQVRLLYRLSLPVYAGTLAVALTVGAGLYSNGVSGAILTGWLGLVVLITVARFVLYKKYATLESADDERAWSTRFIMGAVAMGSLWGVLGSLVMAAADWYFQLLTVFAIAGMVASALVVLTPVTRAFLGFATAAMVPMIIAMYAHGDTLHLITGAILTAFFGVMLAACPVMNRSHVASLRTRFENTDLVQRLSSANQTADDAIAQLHSQLEDQKRIEQALQEATDRVEAMIAASPLAIIEFDVDLIVERWNPAAEVMFGWTKFEVLGRKTPLVPPHLMSEAEAHRVRILNGKSFASVETVRQRKDGTIVDVSVSAAATYDSAGKVAGMVAMFADVSGRKNDREALRRSSARLEALVAASPLAIMVQDGEGVIRRWNQAAERIFGWTEQEAVGKQMLAVPDDKKAEGAGFRERILRGEHFADVEAIRRHKDGRDIPVSLSAAPLRNAHGEARGLVMFAADISERKGAERRQNIQNAVTILLAEADTVGQVIPRVIQTLCEGLGWAAGARRIVARNDGLMRHTEDWGLPAPEIQVFLGQSATRVDTTSENAGLLRRVWAGGQPVWLPDVAQEPSFVRGAAAMAAGLHCAFAFPIMVSGEFYGVIELFAREVRQRDEDVVKIATQISSQIGQFIARKEAESHLTFFANHDTLTRLPNRVMFNERLTQAIARAQRLASMAAVLFIDLDRFKIINDTLGHDAGDELLKQLAARLRECLREGDTIGRQGGDEFVVLVEGVSDPAQVAGVGQKILDTVARPYLIRGHEFHVTASIGISIYPEDGHDQQTLLKNADIAMYRAKEQGKNNHKFYSAQINSHSYERLALETSLRRAVERDEFLLHYQPKVDMRSGRITGVEALIRWQHPELGMVPPGEFIPIAEETGLIGPIGEWVLRTACTEARGWVASGLSPITIAVNLSARQFSSDELAIAILRVLRDTGLDPRLLELELTESTVMHNAERATEILQQLKRLGVRVAIDDFGTGYSSLSYLKRFPISSVKIDRSFVLDLPDDKDDAAITQAVIAMAHSLRLRVVAEGVETPEQFRFLEEHHCDEMQGNYFSKPVDALSIARLLAARHSDIELA